MKNSNKVLIITVLLLPLSLLLYNWLLARAYNAGELQNRYDLQYGKLIPRMLPAFHHIVVNDHDTSSANGRLSLCIEEAGTPDSFVLKTRKGINDLFRYDVREDTLFLSARLKEDQVFFSSAADMLVIQAPALHSIRCTVRELSFRRWNRADSLSMLVAAGEVHFSNVRFGKVDLVAAPHTQVWIDRLSHVRLLDYSLETSSSLHVARQAVDTFHAAWVAPSATIELQGMPLDTKSF